MVGREEGRFLVMRIQEILILAGEEEDRGIGGDEEEGERGENERRGGGVVFLAMQVLQISAGGRGSPLVQPNPFGFGKI